MRKVVIKKDWLVWDDWNTKHISKHNVTQNEIDQILERSLQARKTYQGRLIVFGSTQRGRILAVILKKMHRGYYVFSARDASREERKHL